MASSSAPQDKPNTKPKRAYTKNKYTLSGPDTSGSASSSSVASSQPRIRAASSDSRTKWQKIEDILKIVSKDFGSIGDFLETFFSCSFSFGEGCWYRPPISYTTGCCDEITAGIIQCAYESYHPSHPHPSSEPASAFI